MRGDEAKEACPQIQLVQVPVARGKADLNSYRNAGSEVRVIGISNWLFNFGVIHSFVLTVPKFEIFRSFQFFRKRVAVRGLRLMRYILI